jgi:hypothetical protein
MFQVSKILQQKKSFFLFLDMLNEKVSKPLNKYGWKVYPHRIKI